MGTGSSVDIPVAARSCSHNSKVSYTVHSQVDEGVYGRIFKAVRDSDQVDVALKVPLDPFGPALDSEIKILAELSGCKHVAQMIEKVTTVNASRKRLQRKAFVMKMYDFDFLRLAKDPIPWYCLADLTQQAYSGLAYCHAKGIAHLDLHSGNLFIDKMAGTLVLGDFGQSQRIAKDYGVQLAVKECRELACTLLETSLFITNSRAARASACKEHLLISLPGLEHRSDILHESVALSTAALHAYDDDDGILDNWKLNEKWWSEATANDSRRKALTTALTWTVCTPGRRGTEVPENAAQLVYIPALGCIDASRVGATAIRDAVKTVLTTEMRIKSLQHLSKTAGGVENNSTFFISPS